MIDKIYIVSKRDIDITHYKNILKKYKIEIVSDVKYAKLIIAIGGDGTILKSIRYILKKNIPILSVNCGKLGFLSTIQNEQFEKVIKEIINKNYDIEERTLFEVKVNNKKYYSLNEMCIIKSNMFSKLVEIEVYDVTNNKQFINKYRGDGLIVSTPTGSTAYSLSAGGPIIHKNIDLILLTAIAPQTLTAVPLILSGESKLEFKLPNNLRKASIYIDGRINIEIDDKTNIRLMFSNKKMKFIKINDKSFYDILREKLMWGENIVR